MYARIKPTITVYPCSRRVPPEGDQASLGDAHVWVTWEVLEREHFSSNGSLIADFSRPVEVDPSLVRHHCYIGDPPSGIAPDNQG